MPNEQNYLAKKFQKIRIDADNIRIQKSYHTYLSTHVVYTQHKNVYMVVESIDGRYEKKKKKI